MTIFTKMNFEEIVILLAAVGLASTAYNYCDVSFKSCTCFNNTSSEVFLDCHSTNLDAETVCSICEHIRNVQVLDLSNNSLGDLPNNCFEKCDALKMLSLASNNISAVHKDVFQGLASLKHINLEDNRLIRNDGILDVDPFCHLRTLQTLRMRNNSQNNYTAWVNMCDLCQVLTKLNHLDISENNVLVIQSRCFANCTSLEQLSLASNNLVNLTKASFENTETLKSLNLDNTGLLINGMLKVPELFKPLINLEELRVQKNSMVKTDRNCYTYFANIANNSLQNLRNLYLDGLPNGVFCPQFLTSKQMTHVNFSGETSYCFIFFLSRDTFQFTPYLRSLDLSHCNISKVYQHACENLSHLTYLNLSFNLALGFPSLHNISYGLQFTNIEVLDYSKVYKTFGLTTQINRYDICFLQNTSLKEVHINSNRIGNVEINALMLFPQSLEVLVAEDNKLSFGPYVFQIGCMTNLKRLDVNFQGFAHPMKNYNSEWQIEENGIDSSGCCNVTKPNQSGDCYYFEPSPINPWNFSIPKFLKTVNGRSSNLRYEKPPYTIPLKIKSCIESIDISGNILQRATDHFMEISNLKQLNGSSNFIDEISGEIFLNSPNLENLDVSNNRIGPKLAEDENGTIFQNASHLKVLNVSNNGIEFLPKNIFEHLKVLELLDLSFNKITNLDLDFRTMNSLSQLNLQQNKVTTLPVSLLDQLYQFSKRENKTASVDISGNEIDGTCENIEFLSWLVHNPQFFANIEKYLFKDTLQGKTKSYAEFKTYFENFERGCQTYTAIIVVSVLFILMSIMIIVGGLIYRYRWRLKYLYYMAKARYNGYIPVRDQELNAVFKYEVFISYAEEDYRFATVDIYKRLEEAGFSICLHQKDFLPGNYIGDNIIKAIKQSRITLILLSPAFLRSKWCIFEFNMARMESMYNRNGENILFVIMYKSVDLTLISREMQDCLESESYLEFPDDETQHPSFWRLLIQALYGTGYRLLE